MSRNFELMQNLGRERELYDAQAESVAEGRIPPPAVAPATPLQLAMEPGQREEILKLVQRVFLGTGMENVRLVVFSALEEGDGATWTCARAAEMLASQVSGSVCVVDANFQSPGLHQEFGVKNDRGFSEALSVSDPVAGFATSLERANLSVLTAGAAVESVNADALRWRLADLRREFSYILVDAPPVNGGADVVSLARAGEGLVLVLKAHSSRRETARQAVQELNEAGVRILGAVLNQRTFPIPESVYRKL